MAHQTLIESSDGELIDVEIFCSDFCARTSPHYAGWYGCVEILDPTPCHSCGSEVSS